MWAQGEGRRGSAPGAAVGRGPDSDLSSFMPLAVCQTFMRPHPAILGVPDRSQPTISRERAVIAVLPLLCCKKQSSKGWGGGPPLCILLGSVLDWDSAITLTPLVLGCSYQGSSSWNPNQPQEPSWEPGRWRARGTLCWEQRGGSHHPREHS